MNLTIAELAAIVENPEPWLAKTKARIGCTVIGCFPLRVPYELIDAAGAIPIDIYGGSGQMTAAAEYLLNIVCYPVRNAFERLLAGQLKSLDGAVFASLCAGTMTGAGLWQWLNRLSFFHLLTVRHGEPSPEAIHYYRYQLEALKASLESFVGRAITDESIAASIRRYNESRTLLDKLATISHFAPDVLSPEDFAVISAASGLMARSEYLEIIGDILAKLPQSKSSPAVAGVPLVVAGNLCDFPQFSILSEIREAGAVVVADDTPFGSRLRQQVPENVAPLDALVQYYFEMPPCPTLYHRNLDTNAQHFQRLVQDSGAAGLLILRPKYCDTLGLDYPIVLKRLSEAGVRALSLDVDGREPLSGQVETRLQAFVEMLRE